MTPNSKDDSWIVAALVGTAATIIAWLICAAALAWDYLL